MHTLTAHNLLRGGDPRQANLYALRARDLLSAGAKPISWLTAGTEFFVPAYVRWLDDDLAGVVRELDAAIRGLDHRTENERLGLALQAGYVYLTLGQVKEAEKAFQNIRAQDRSYCLALIAFAQGDREMIRKYLSGYVWPDPAPNPGPGILSAILAARVGSLPPAERFSLRLAEPVTRTPSGVSGPEWSDHLKAATGEIALRRGDPRRARALLEQAEEKLHGQAWPYFFLTAESLAEVYEHDGRHLDAARVLERASRERTRSSGFLGGSGFLWMRNQERLANLDRRLGRKEDARAIEAELLKLLAYADPDYPLLVELKARRQAYD